MKVRKKITSTDWNPRPWKNGKGTTVELMIFPEGSSLQNNDFLWRASLATIGHSGPFSIFESYNRTIVQISGAPLLLTDLDSKKSHPLTLFQPFEFSGSAPIECKLVGQEAKDLNAMIKKDRGKIEMRLLAINLGNSLLVNTSAQFVLMYVISGEVEVQTTSAPTKLAALDTLILERDDSKALQPQSFGVHITSYTLASQMIVVDVFCS